MLQELAWSLGADTAMEKHLLKNPLSLSSVLQAQQPAIRIAEIYTVGPGNKIVLESLHPFYLLQRDTRTIPQRNKTAVKDLV